MGIDSINLALTLDNRNYQNKLDASRKGLSDLGNMRMRDGTGRFIKATTNQLSALEKQAKRTQSVLGGGLLGKMDLAASKLSKLGRIMRIGGLGVGAAGGIAKLSGMFMSRGGKATTEAGKAKLAARQARGKKWSGIGDKMMGAGSAMGAAGFATGLLGNIVGTAPGIAKLLGGSKAASGEVGKLSSNLGKLSGAASNAGKSSSRLGGVLRGVAGAAAGVATGIIAVGAGLVAGAASGLGYASSMEEAKTQFEVFTGSATKADAILGELQKRADVTPFSTKDYVAGGTALMSAAEGSKDKLMELLKTSEMLTVLNPAQGLEGAALAIKNALANDFVSLQDRFNIAPSTIQKYKKMGLTGQQLIRAVLKEMNVGEASVGKLGKTARGLWSTISSFIEQIRGALAGGLFAWLKERMTSAVAWIDTNKTWVMDTATGIGMMIGNVVGQVSNWISSAWQTASSMGSTVYQFFAGLPSKIAASFQSGELMAGVVDLLASLSVVAWNTLKFLGKMAWDAIVNGVPLLVTIVAKLVVDGLRSSLGDRISGYLGLDDISQTLGDVASGGATVMKDNFKQNFGTFMSEQRGALSAAGDAAGALGNTLGWGDAKAAAASGRGGPNFGLLDQARQMGADQRVTKEREAAQVQWGGGQQGAQAQQLTMPKRPQPSPQQLKMMEKYNAQAQMRQPRQKIDVRFTSMDGKINPLSR